MPWDEKPLIYLHFTDDNAQCRCCTVNDTDTDTDYIGQQRILKMAFSDRLAAIVLLAVLALYGLFTYSKIFETLLPLLGTDESIQTHFSNDGIIYSPCHYPVGCHTPQYTLGDEALATCIASIKSFAKRCGWAVATRLGTNPTGKGRLLQITND